MKRVLLLIGVLMALSVPSYAFSSEYRRLTDGCRYYESKGSVDAYAECLNYVSAVAEILTFWGNNRIRACIPAESVASGQLAAVVQKSFSRQPEISHDSASALVAATLSNAFPCKR
jgi:Rap1a immunity proteins